MSDITKKTFVKRTFTKITNTKITRTLLASATIATAAGFSFNTLAAEEIVRYPLPNGSTFPIAMAVEVPAGTTLIHHSGLTPAPANPKAEVGTAEYYGDTETQALSVFNRMKKSLNGMGLGFADVVKMTAFLVGDPALGGKMDFAGFMKAYSKYFGTEEQPNKPARSAVQVAGLVRPGMFIEIEVIVARSK